MFSGRKQTTTPTNQNFASAQSTAQGSTLETYSVLVGGDRVLIPAADMWEVWDVDAWVLEHDTS